MVTLHGLRDTGEPPSPADRPRSRRSSPPLGPPSWSQRHRVKPPLDYIVPKSLDRESSAATNEDEPESPPWCCGSNRHTLAEMSGTPFQQKVWSYLRTIPRGETRTYAEVAKGIGHPRAIRAVASACARNEHAVVVPCHRVIRSDGGLGGYRWGVERKRRLLELEGAIPSHNSD